MKAAHDQPPGWREALNRRMDGWMASPGLYRWAIGNPVGRWITRRRANALFAVMAGFVHSQVLLACVRLHVFELVLAAPRTLDELLLLTPRRLSRDALGRLLDSALSLQLLSLRPGGRYGLGPLGAPLTAHAGIRAMVEHNALLYEDLRDPLQLLEDKGKASMNAYWTYAAETQAPPPEPAHRPPPALADASARYSELMSLSQRFVIDELLAVYPFGQHRCVLDVGGGQGGWVSELAEHAPHLKLKLFDLPPVAALAQARIERRQLADRITTHPGSFTQDALPLGADLVTLLRVAHDHSDAVVRVLLKAIWTALPPGGHLLLAEPMAQPDGQPALGDPYFHFYLLAMGEGRLRTAAELTALMSEAGFAPIRRIANPMTLHASVLLGQKRA